MDIKISREGKKIRMLTDNASSVGPVFIELSSAGLSNAKPTLIHRPNRTNIYKTNNKNE